MHTVMITYDLKSSDQTYTQVKEHMINALGYSEKNFSNFHKLPNTVLLKHNITPYQAVTELLASAALFKGVVDKYFSCITSDTFSMAL